MLPQPIQYQGSKRKLASTILKYMPKTIERLVEPFAGSAAISIAAASNEMAESYWINDLNQMLVKLLQCMTEQPKAISSFYRQLWSEQFTYEYGFVEHYYHVRESFNKTHDERLFLYLLARCVKGAVRYNSDGNFNQSPDKRRHGTQPETMQQNIFAFSRLLSQKAVFSGLDYREVLSQTKQSDLVYMDPPYQGVCGDRDSRYFAQIKFDDFVNALHELNHRRIPFLLSYDGKRGSRQFGSSLPDSLRLTRVELEAGRSAQSTLLGRSELTIESLYISQELSRHLEQTPPKSAVPEQIPLLEKVGYA